MFGLVKRSASLARRTSG